MPQATLFRHAAETFLFDLDGRGLQGGIELGHRRQVNSWVFEAAFGANFDGNNRDTQTFDTTFTVLDENDDPTGQTVTGSGDLSVKKKRDLYLVARAGHLFGSEQRLLLGVGAGLSYANFDVDGSHAFDINPSVPTAFSESENVFGVVLEAYGRYKLSRNWDIGLLGTYKKWNDFSASDSASGVHHYEHPYDERGTVTSNVTDSVKVSPHEWAVKGTLTYTID